MPTPAEALSREARAAELLRLFETFQDATPLEEELARLVGKHGAYAVLRTLSGVVDEFAGDVINEAADQVMDLEDDDLYEDDEPNTCGGCGCEVDDLSDLCGDCAEAWG